MKHYEMPCQKIDYPNTAIDNLRKSLTFTNKRISSVTPYTETKDVYIENTQVTFSKIKGSIFSAIGVTYSGIQFPTTITEYDDEIVVSFDALTEGGTVTIIEQ